MLSAVDQDPREPAPPLLKRKIAAILAADVAGYSRLVAEDEEGTLHDLAAARTVMDARVRRGGGRIFNTAGDSVMCEFDSAVEAVRAAIDIQRSLAERATAAPPGRRLAFRMGITIGDVVERDGDLLGDGVNLAARLEGLAEPGSVCVSRSVHEAVANKVAATFEDLGERRVKNIPQPVHAFLIPAPGQASAPGPRTLAAERVVEARPAAAPATGRRLRLGGAAVLAAVIAAGLGVQVLRRGSDSPPATTARPAISDDSSSAETAPAEPGRADLPRTAPTGAEPTAAARPDPASSLAGKAETGRTDIPKAGAAKLDPTKSDTAKSDTTRSDNAKAIARPEKPASVAEATAQFAATARLGRIPDAGSLADLYHNARWLEGRGDKAGALRVFAAIAPVAGDFLDVDLRYAALLRAVNGAAAARQTLLDLARNAPSRAASLAHMLQVEPDDRRGRLEAFVAANPDGGTADYLLAEELMARGGGPTLTERRLAFDGYDRFLEAASGSTLAPALMDGALLTTWTDNARRRRGEVEAFFAAQPSRPSAAVTRSETGWVAQIALPEPALAVSVRLGERGDFVSTGLLPTIDPRTGKPAPNLRVPLPAISGRTTLYVSYVDRSGREAGPFPQSFDPRAALVAAERETLERFPDSWVSFRPDVADVLSIAQLLSNRCAIQAATIEFGDAPAAPLALPPCDERSPTAIPPDARSAIALPPGTDAVTVRLAYADGTESAARIFRRP